MDITLIESAFGPGYDLYAIVIDEVCLVQEFIDRLTEKEQNQVIALFQLILNSGVPFNKRKFRNIGDQIYELKTRSGVRILGFFGGADLPRSLILTHGFYKQHSKILVREKKKAILWHREYFSEQMNIV